MTNIYMDLAARIRKKEPVALAVILETNGSAPQGAGAAAIFSSRKLVAGTIGGGSLEACVFRKAAEALRKGEPLVVSFALKGVAIEGQEPICGGDVRVLVDPRPQRDGRILFSLADSLGRGIGGVLSTSICKKQNGKIVLTRDWIPAELRSSSDKEIAAALADGRPRLAGTRLFLEPLFPQARLVIAGAGHIGRAVSHLGRLLDFDVTVIDDRREFANKKNLPDADRIVCREIGPALSEMPIDGNTYVVIVTRGHQKDAEALRACINSGAGYIGMIGSRSKIALERREFIDRKWATAGAFDRVHAPIGLPIRSETVPEIAVSIAAELVLTRRRNADRERVAG
ncbi:MAG: XdhC family protein [Candidatus Aminicenantes bacterium]|nr:XdhC family protein [Candidatus Aminicenantes bacterium]